MCATKRKKSTRSRRRSKKSPFTKWTALLALIFAAAAWFTQSDGMDAIYDILDIPLAPSVIDGLGGDDTDVRSSESITKLPPNVTVVEKKSILMHLEGKTHPDTGIPYERMTTQLPDGTYVSMVAPVFPFVFVVVLPEELYLENDRTQFAYANKKLKEAIATDASLAKVFSEDQLAQIKANKRPKGYTWHHDVPVGVLRLVDTDIHAKTRHTGGRSLWGGGGEYR
ncbi:HNH endonuclease (plasmid) [Entomospira entomophila]|uniref:HNH endonuclease n=1 Tax=Entomospira entomophila TaxID=2719988 RepID=A0A968KX23_9SPIO|nr:HNH endonuclease [Entomospira entomophilus]NIZ41415.1 HNH endonuclease [Entomospira entomophilus]WDI36365.1 HNH endonuclease [Entomospira entomophilus]